MTIYTPSANADCTVHLPGEITRATCLSVIDADRVMVELTSILTAKAHNYRKGDKIEVRRGHDGLQEVWEAYTPDRPMMQRMAR